MKEQILMFQQKLAEKETKYIKLDNELRTKKKEFEKLKLKFEENGGKCTPGGCDNQQPESHKGYLLRVNNHQS